MWLFNNSVVDSDPGSNAAPGSGMGKKNQDPNPGCFFDVDPDPGSAIFLNLDPGRKKFGSGKNIPDTQHCLIISFFPSLMYECRS
jgi:hypothetical protein